MITTPAADVATQAALSNNHNPIRKAVNQVRYALPTHSLQPPTQQVTCMTAVGLRATCACLWVQRGVGTQAAALVRTQHLHSGMLSTPPTLIHTRAACIATLQADALGRTPLMLACHGGHHECVKQLLDLGADWSAMDIKGQTPLHHAALSAQGGQCVELLLRAAGLWDEEGPAPPKDKTLLT